jgi:hypothetical protein
MNLIAARRKAKSIFSKDGQALKWGGFCEIGVYVPVFMNCYSSFHMIARLSGS